MNGSLVANDVVTVVSLVVPTAFVAGLWLWFRSTVDQGKLMNVFIDVFTVCAAAIVLASAFFPKYFDIVGDNRAFLIVVSLSAVLHATSSVATVISGERWRSLSKSDQRPADKVK